MLFNSLAFAVFLPTVFAIYWSLDRVGLRAQNLFLVAASYFFYGWWDYRFAGLMAVSSAVDFILGVALENETRADRRRLLLGVSLTVNLGILGFFKYFNFFADSAVVLLRAVGFHPDPVTLNVILPVAVSFYTFQELGYIFDVYRRTIRATTDPVAFFAFVSFFPHLVAGPIQRTNTLLPQMERPRRFDALLAHDGLRQMLWGFVKKVVVADNLAGPVSSVFANPGAFDRASLMLSAAGFALQLYCDFSGYSDIAIGTARLFGVSIMRNFAYPYFATNFRDFWRRWHISLSTWFRDYVYIPLGGSRLPGFRHARNILIVFAVSGLWHGAGWTFVIWGLLNGIYFLAFPALPGRFARFAAPGVFTLWALSLVFFRSSSLGIAVTYFRGLFGPAAAASVLTSYPRWALTLAAIVLACEWAQRDRPHALDIGHWFMPLRWSTYVVLGLSVAWLGAFGENPFIYFQF